MAEESNTLFRNSSDFSRVEKASMAPIILTAIILAVSIVFMQTRLLQVYHDLFESCAQIGQSRLVDNIKQEVNELTRYEGRPSWPALRI